MCRVKNNTEDLMIKREVNSRKITSLQKNHTRETTIKTRLSKRKKIIKIQNKKKILRNKTINQFKTKRINYKRKNQ